MNLALAPLAPPSVTDSLPPLPAPPSPCYLEASPSHMVTCQVFALEAGRQKLSEPESPDIHVTKSQHIETYLISLFVFILLEPESGFYVHSVLSCIVLCVAVFVCARTCVKSKVNSEHLQPLSITVFEMGGRGVSR